MWAATVPSETLRIEVRASDARAEVLGEWGALHQRAGDDRVATSAEWIEAWLEHYGDVVEHRFVMARADGRLRGACLLSAGCERRLGPFALKSLHLGTAGERADESVCVEYNHVLAEPRYRGSLLDEVVALFQREPRWDTLCLDGFASEDAAALAARLPLERRGHASRYFHLARARAEGREIVDLLGRGTRSNIRRRVRHFGSLTCEWADSLEGARAILRELSELHQARWQADGEPGSFASPRFTGFVTALVDRLFARGGIVLFRARSEGRTLGCLCLLRDGNRLLDYVSGIATFDERGSPGLVTHYLCMQHALERGFDAYDFLAGDRQHKQNLSTDANTLVWGEHRRPRVKFHIADAYRHLKAVRARLRAAPA